MIPLSGGDSLSDQDFRRLAALIHARAGIRIPPSKHVFLESRLRKRLRRLRFSSYKAYCAWLFDQGGLADEEIALLDCVTTNKTEFFREPHHFTFLEREALPRLVSQGRGLARPLKIWSAACSNGAEPYSLAMLLQDYAEREPGFQYEILASDLSLTMLAEAQRAIYAHATIDPVPMDLRKRYLLRDESGEEVRIVPLLRRKVRFARINLVDGVDGPDTLQDIIFCRNVLIYFDKATQIRVLRHLCRVLRPSGYLVLGHSETIGGFQLPLRAVSTTLFIREGLGEAWPPQAGV